ncbi:hypothetical protein [Rufibacter roseolus]|uniref:hypothetical protein n=1 Tax=Rufibacter roseolus TaxID=2817375 RepID=UPI001B303E75|nr:hypothetical protein [Rufibacter roseolus]
MMLSRTLPKNAGKVSAIIAVLVTSGFLYLFISVENGFWVTTRTMKLNLDDRAQEIFIVIDKEAIHPNAMKL